ncbi:MAG: hypothetical protein AAFV86_04775 [Pseudomonadota bacterium]
MRALRIVAVAVAGMLAGPAMADQVVVSKIMIAPDGPSASLISPDGRVRASAVSEGGDVRVSVTLLSVAVSEPLVASTVLAPDQRFSMRLPRLDGRRSDTVELRRMPDGVAMRLVREVTVVAMREAPMSLADAPGLPEGRAIRPAPF